MKVPLSLMAGVLALTVAIAAMVRVEKTSAASVAVEPQYAENDPSSVFADIDAMLARDGMAGETVNQVVTRLDGLIERYPDYGYAMRLKGTLLYNVRKYEASARAFAQYLDRFPEDYNARTSMGAALLALERYQPAVEALTPVAAAFPDYGVANAYLGKAYRGLGNAEEASRLERKADQIKKQGGRSKPPIVWHPKLPSE